MWMQPRLGSHARRRGRVLGFGGGCELEHLLRDASLPMMAALLGQHAQSMYTLKKQGAPSSNVFFFFWGGGGFVFKHSRSTLLYVGQFH